MCDLGERLLRGTFSLTTNSRFLSRAISRSFSRTRSLASTTTPCLSFFTAITFLTVYFVGTFPPPGDTSRIFRMWLVPPGLVTFLTRIFVVKCPPTFFVRIRFVPSADTFFTCFLMTFFVPGPPSELELDPRRCRIVRFFTLLESREELLELELESESDESEPLLLELSELELDRRRGTGTFRTFFTTVSVSFFCFNTADDDEE